MTIGTINDYTYELIDLSFSLDKDNSSAVEIYKVAWVDCLSFAETMLGGIYNGGWLSGATSVYCQGLRVTKVDISKWNGGTYNATPEYSGTTLVPYKDAKITVTYGTLRSDPSSGLIEINASVSGESVQLPTGNLKWQSDNKPLGDGDVTPSALMPCVEVSLGLKYCATDGLATIGNLVGCINSVPLQITPTFSVAAECAMALGGSISSNVNHLDSRSYNRSVKIVCRTQSWNKCMRMSSGSWEYVTPTMYQSANLSSLLSFSAV